jgi:hypothetical protein
MAAEAGLLPKRSSKLSRDFAQNAALSFQRAGTTMKISAGPMLITHVESYPS